MIASTGKPGVAWRFHLFYFTSTGVLAALLQSAVGTQWATIAMALLWLPSIGLLPWLWQRWRGEAVEVQGLAIVLVLVSWMGVVTNIGALPLLLTEKAAPTVAASALSGFPDPLLAHVRDGKVQTRFAYRHTGRHYDSRRSTTTLTHTCVAPVTPVDWSPRQAVPLWAVCPNDPAECSRCPHWRSVDADLIPPLSWGESSAHEAVRAAARTQGLLLGDPLRVAVWVGSARDALVTRVGFAVASIWGMFLLWAVCCISVSGIRSSLAWWRRN